MYNSRMKRDEVKASLISTVGLVLFIIMMIIPPAGVADWQDPGAVDTQHETTSKREEADRTQRDQGSDEFPRFAIGVGSFALNYESDQQSADWNGFTLRGTMISSKHFAMRGRIYNTEASGFWGNTQEISGFDFSGLLGTNWNQGINFFGGFGFYSEDLTDDLQPDDSWSGLMLSIGLGYQWQNASLELSGDLRDPSDPEEYADDSNASYASGSLTIEYIFR